MVLLSILHSRVMFQMLYDTDILEESVLLEWGSKKSSKKVCKELSLEIHNRAEPFLTWLKEAEEEEESSEDEEDDLEVFFYLNVFSAY